MVRYRINLLLIPILFLGLLYIYSIQNGVHSAEEVYKLVISSMKTVDDLELATNTCPQAYDNGTTGGCYWSKRDSSSLAVELYGALQSKELHPVGVLRQDYLAWTARLRDGEEKYTVVMWVSTILDAKPENKLRWEYKAKGYQTEIIMSVIERKK